MDRILNTLKIVQKIEEEKREKKNFSFREDQTAEDRTEFLLAMMIDLFNIVQTARQSIVIMDAQINILKEEIDKLTDAKNAN